jgi:predicted N-formylglutamate amidohydrolase
VPNTLLSQTDPHPVKVFGNILAPAPFFFIGDHAGSAIPADLGDLGLEPAELARHIALDIGVEELGPQLAGRLGAPFLRQAFSRLVIDCNRDPLRRDAVVETSDGTAVPGNAGLAAEARQARVDEVFAPYHAAIAEALDARMAAGLRTILVALHSFTPVINGFTRPWHIGVLFHDGVTGFALSVLARLQAQQRYVAEANEPYAMDGTDFTVPHHAYLRGMDYVELEIRQDLIDPRGTNEAGPITDLLVEALADCARR